MNMEYVNKVLNYEGCDNIPCNQCALYKSPNTPEFEKPCADIAMEMARDSIMAVLKDGDREMLKQYEIRYLMYEQDEERTVIWVSHSYDEAQITFTNNYEPYKILSIEEAR